MKATLTRLAAAIRGAFSTVAQRLHAGTRTVADAGDKGLRTIGSQVRTRVRVSGGVILTALLLGLSVYLIVKYPPVATVERGQLGVRTNQLTGTATRFSEGPVLALPLVHSMHIYSLRDQTYRPVDAAQAQGPAPLQSVEGLSFGVDLAVRYAVDSAQLNTRTRSLPADIEQDVVQPAVQGTIYTVFARYTMREIFSTKREEIQQTVSKALAEKLAAEGLVLRSVQIGKVDLPADYRRGMESLLAEELASEKMRYTLDLKEKQVKETALAAQAEKVRREKAAEAAAQEQLIAARGQEEAMKHVLPFKQRQIEQRQLEAEADKVARIKTADASAQARRIEAQGEAEARQKLADAEAYRADKLNKVASEQMAREGAIVTQHPLLVQKALADKLSDKIQVIIAPPPTNGDFIGSALLGKGPRGTPGQTAQVAQGNDTTDTKEQ